MYFESLQPIFLLSKQFLLKTIVGHCWKFLWFTQTPFAFSSIIQTIDWSIAELDASFLISVNFASLSFVDRLGLLFCLLFVPTSFHSTSNVLVLHSRHMVLQDLCHTGIASLIHSSLCD